MNAKKMIALVLLTAGLGLTTVSAQAGMGPMFGRDDDNLAVGTVLTMEVKVLTGKALFTDRLIPVFAADGKEFELRLPMTAFSGVNIKQGDTLEIQGVFVTLKTPDGKVVYHVRPQIVKTGGQVIDLLKLRDDRQDRRNGPRDDRRSDRPMPRGMGPMDGR